jgi:carbamoyltransferase
MHIIGITAYYHDSSACLFKDGKLIFACEEERFSGIKHDRSFPHKTLKYIFSEYKLTPQDIDSVCYYEDPKLRFHRSRSFFASIFTGIKVYYNLRKLGKEIHFTSHHLSHLYYSYLSSPYKDAAIVSIDGVGETQTLMIGKGENEKIKVLKAQEYPHSLGLFYSAMTAFLGFKPNEGEYKLMGLAGYGNPDTFIEKVRTLITYENKNLRCNMDYFAWDVSNRSMFTDKLLKLLQIDYRLPEEPILQVHKDLAAAVQVRYEEIFFEILKEVKELTKSKNICLGGGCAYNGTANGKIIDSKLFTKVWIPPAPSDAGSSIGSCLYYLSGRFKNIRIKETPFLGPEYTDREILNELRNYKNISYKKLKTKELYIETAKLLKEGYVVGWFRNKIEFGARALGNRSILANPTIPGIKDRINKVIKKREGFRPFAPMVAFENQNTFFESKEYIPYMNQIVKVREEYKNLLPGITHVDGTARIQSVKKSNLIHKLLKEFEKVSKFPILLNTSFNVKDKTMVLTPKDAISTFLDTEMDFVIIQNYLVRKG